MSRICKSFKLGENGVCENYIESKGLKESCNQSCKVAETKSNQKSKMRKLLDNQIIGIHVPYETEIFNRQVKIKNVNRMSLIKSKEEIINVAEEIENDIVI